MMRGGRHMPQLVGIAHDVDRRDQLAVDRHADGVIDFAIHVEQGARGAVDHGRLDAYVTVGILGRERHEEACDPVGAHDRIERRGLPAAAIGDRDGICAQQSGQTRYIAAGDGLAERGQKPCMMIRCRGGGLACIAHRAAGPRRQLPARNLSPVEHRSDIRERLVEDVVKQEGGALQRRQPVQRQQQGERQVVSQFRRRVRRKALRIEHRFRQPGADIDFALRPGALERVETQPRHNGDKERFGIVNILRAGEADVGILHHVLGIAAAAEHAVGKPKQPPAMRRQRIAFTRLV
jgi:hypothetical protein